MTSKYFLSEIFDVIQSDVALQALEFTIKDIGSRFDSYDFIMCSIFSMVMGRFDRYDFIMCSFFLYLFFQ